MNEPVVEALNRLAPQLAGEGARVEGLQRLSQGASMEMVAFDVAGRKGRRELIMRRRPGPLPDDGRANPMWVEAAVIQACGAHGVPVPPIVHVFKAEEGIGEAYVMERVPGETLGRKIVSDPGFDAVRPRLAFQCGEILARLHATPEPDGVPLRTADAVAELDRYEESYRVSGARRPVLDLAFKYLRARAPEAPEIVLLHGDFRNGNIMFHPEQGVAAVLDWELVHLGDAAEDLGWICTNSWRFGRPDRPVGGFGEYQDLLDGYAAGGGKGMTLERVLFWNLLGSLKWGVMCLGMYMSWVQGGPTATVERPMIGRRVSETEIDILNILERSA